MTGENPRRLGPTGGITTQNTGAQPQRARLRATKAPTGLLSQPTRTVRVADRDTCVPSNPPARSAAAGAVPLRPRRPWTTA